MRATIGITWLLLSLSVLCHSAWSTNDTVTGSTVMKDGNSTKPSSATTAALTVLNVALTTPKMAVVPPTAANNAAAIGGPPAAPSTAGSVAKVDATAKSVAVSNSPVPGLVSSADSLAAAATQPVTVSTSVTLLPAGTPATVPAGTPAAVPAGTPAAVPAGTPTVVPAGTPAVVPAGTPAVVPAGTPAVTPAGTPAVVLAGTAAVLPPGTPVVVPAGGSTSNAAATPSHTTGLVPGPASVVTGPSVNTPAVGTNQPAQVTTGAVKPSLTSLPPGTSPQAGQGVVATTAAPVATPASPAPLPSTTAPTPVRPLTPTPAVSTAATDRATTQTGAGPAGQQTSRPTWSTADTRAPLPSTEALKMFNFTYRLNSGQEEQEREKKELLKVCQRLMGNFLEGSCTLEMSRHQDRVSFDSVLVTGRVKPSLAAEHYDDVTRKPNDNRTLIAILSSCGALLIMIVILAVCASHHRKPYSETQQHLTEELHVVENGYHDNPTLEVMEVQPEMQEKKLALNGEFNDNWIVPIDLMKEELPDEEDTHL